MTVSTWTSGPGGGLLLLALLSTAALVCGALALPCNESSFRSVLDPSYCSTSASLLSPPRALFALPTTEAAELSAPQPVPSSSDPIAPLVLTALSPPAVTTVVGLCRGHALPGSERYCVHPGGAADVTVVAELHRAEGSTWPTQAELSTLTLRLLVDALHPAVLSPLNLLPQTLPPHSSPDAAAYRLSLPFRGVLSATTARVGLFDLLFAPAQSHYVAPLGPVNSTVAVEVAAHVLLTHH